MSLQVWLPLTKNVEQQGLSNITVTNNGATFSSNGKLGGCYTVDNSKQIGCSNNITLGNTFSVVFWSKINSKNVDWGNIFKIYKDGYDYIGMCLAYKTDTNPKLGFHIFRNNGSNAREAVIDGYKDYTLNEWFHTVIIVTPTKATVYRNGEIYNTFVINKSFPLITNYSLWLGKNGIGNGLDCSINDFRIYDNALSPREVKEISKGLVLHYPLAMPGGENILKNSLTNFPQLWDGSGDGRTLATQSGVSVSEWGCNDGLRVYGKSGSSNALCLLISNSTHGLTVPSISVSGQKYTPSIYIKNNHQNAIYIAFNGLGTGQTINQGEIKRVILNATGNGKSYLQFTISASGANKEYDFTFWHPKIELGEVCTPWIPATTDSLYSAMGFNDGIEYDVSGYGHNGTRSGTLTCTSDTPRYNVSSSFNTNGSYLVVSGLTTIGFSNSFSIAWWGKVTTFNSKMMWGFGDGILLNGLYNGNLWNTGDGSDNPIYQPGTTTQITVPSVNVWHHYVMTGDGTQNCLFVDGVLYGKSKTYKAISGTTISFNGWGYNSNYRYANEGDLKLSDFRLYATALSADDVLDLYHTPISLSNNGTLLTQGEYEEV